MGKKRDKFFARDVPEFVAIFRADLNPGVDIETLRARGYVQITYINSKGQQETDACRKIITRLRYSGKPDKIPDVSLPAADVPGFTELFRQELNPGLDINTLYEGSFIRMSYINSRGELETDLCSNVCHRLKRRLPADSRYSGQAYPALSSIPGFMERFDASLNPGTDPEVVRINSSALLAFRESDGSIASEPCWKSAIIRFGFNPNRFPAVMIPEFSASVTLDLNTGIDLGTLYTDSQEKIRYITDDGTEEDTVFRYLSRGCSAKKKAGYAKDNPDFMRIWDPSLNPGVDINTLRCTSRQPITYMTDHGPETDKLESLIRRGCIPKPGLGKAADVPGFIEMAPPELNPDVDMENLTAGSGITVNYYGINGTVCQGKVAAIVSHCRAEQRRAEAGLAKDDPEFMALFRPELNPGINLEMLGRGSLRDVSYYDDQGNLCRAATTTIFKRLQRRRNMRPRVRKEKKETGRHIICAAEQDPELLDFFNPELNPGINIETLPVQTTKCRSVKWQCPYCGYVFEKGIVSICGRHPKCPRCRDTGIWMESAAIPEGVPVLIRGRRRRNNN